MPFRIAFLAALLLAAVPPVSVAEGVRPIECRCRANGQNFALGERTCLLTPDGYRLDQCRMIQNVTSWRVEPDSCVMSALASEQRHSP